MGFKEMGINLYNGNSKLYLNFVIFENIYFLYIIVLEYSCNLLYMMMIK